MNRQRVLGHHKPLNLEATASALGGALVQFHATMPACLN